MTVKRTRTTLLAEPKPRADGLCVVCGKHVPRTAGRYGDPDNFCSSRCCRTFFGTSLEVDESKPRNKEMKRWK